MTDPQIHESFSRCYRAFVSAVSDKDRSDTSLGFIRSELVAQGHSDSCILRAFYEALNRGDAYVVVPMRELDEDSDVYPLDLFIGLTTLTEAVAKFKRIHAVREAPEGTELVTDFYVLDVHAEDEPDVPLPSGIAYADRDTVAAGKPAGCTFPWAPLERGEALQLRMQFDRSGILMGRTISVGPRASSEPAE
jgi:hypothetical protein